MRNKDFSGHDGVTLAGPIRAGPAIDGLSFGVLAEANAGLSDGFQMVFIVINTGNPGQRYAFGSSNP